MKSEKAAALRLRVMKSITLEGMMRTFFVVVTVAVAMLATGTFSVVAQLPEPVPSFESLGNNTLINQEGSPAIVNWDDYNLGELVPPPGYPPLAEPVLVMGETDGFRPLHMSIYGRYAAIVAAKTGASRIYLYDTKEHVLKLIGEDGKIGIQIGWGHLHYKSGQVAINDKYIAYARESGDIDQLILREIADPEKVKIYDLPDGMTLSQMSVGNDDTGGFGIIGYKRDKGNLLHGNVYYFELATEAFKLIHAASVVEGADPENAWLYNRGPQTRNGTMTWIFGSHDCAKATIYYWNGSFDEIGSASIKPLPVPMYEEQNMQNPCMVTMFEKKIYMHTYNIRCQVRSGGVAEWDPVKDTLRHIGDGLTPCLAGKWLLLSNPQGLFKLDTTADDPWASKTLAIPPAPNSSHYTQSGARLSRTGRFVYFLMDDMSGANTRVYLADIHAE